MSRRQDAAIPRSAPPTLPRPLPLAAAVAAGGALGALARFGLSGWVTTWAAAPFPWGTLAANALGSFLLGIFAAVGTGRLPTELRAGLTVGLCGGMTTFSTFDLEVHALLTRGDWAAALAYAGISVTACLAGVAAGLRLARGEARPTVGG
jgi:fluoride exporter